MTPSRKCHFTGDTLGGRASVRRPACGEAAVQFYVTDYLTDSGDTYCFGRCGRHLVSLRERRHAREVSEDELAVYLVHDS